MKHGHHSRAAVVLIILFALTACDQRGAEKSAPLAQVRKPTASEVFALRSKCTELGDTILTRMQGRWDDAGAESIARLDTGSDANAKTRYNPATNRCYVEVDVGTINPDREVYEEIRYLYDGQTREMLAFYSTHGPGDPNHDSCTEHLGMPEHRSCQAINNKILELMADDRRQ